jgi:hypothetical protein
MDLIKNSRDEIHETHSRIVYQMQEEMKLQFGYEVPGMILLQAYLYIYSLLREVTF